MRLEDMTTMQLRRSLKRLHRRINNQVFFGTLRDIPIFLQYCIISQDGQDCCGAFNEDQESIYISELFVSDLARCRTQREQCVILCQTLLHEMIHQYCYEYGIDDTDHGTLWTDTAGKFHLISCYEYGEPIQEHIEPLFENYIRTHYSL